MLLQDRGDHLLGGGLAHTAGDADHRQVKVAAIAGRDLFQGRQHVGNDNHRASLAFGHPFTDAAGRTAVKGSRDKIMPVYTFSPESREQVSVFNRPGVDYDFADPGLRVAGSAKPTAAEGGRASDGHMFHVYSSVIST